MAVPEASSTPSTNVEAEVVRRYSEGAKGRQADLCCPVDYDPRYLKVIPDEVIERDYGCGDPSRYLREGETVLDLGSGGGKICFIASQVVGPRGRVIGVDMNDDMLAMARRAAPEVARSIGHENVQFHKGRIQDLALDHDKLGAWLDQHPVKDLAGYERLESKTRELREQEPMVATASIDVVVSNCVLNLVRSEDKEMLFREIFRVLKKGGRAVISDIVCDEPVPVHLQQNAELWSGCLSGAYQESAFVKAFERAGFHGMRLVDRNAKPWATVEGIEFRSLTVEAFKGKQGPCLERHQAVIYTGPWKQVEDDDGHVLRRGERMAVCDKTYHLYQQEPYGDSILPVEPRSAVPLEQAPGFDCTRSEVRSPRETKGEGFSETSGCSPGDACC